MERVELAHLEHWIRRLKLVADSQEEIRHFDPVAVWIYEMNDQGWTDRTVREMKASDNASAACA